MISKLEIIINLLNKKLLLARYNQNNKRPGLIWINLILLGMLAGALIGVASISGSNINPTKIKLDFFTFMCKATSPIHELTDCSGFVALLSFLTLSITIFGVLKQAVKLKETKILSKLEVRPWVEGVFIYLIGIGIGFFALRIFF